MVLLQLREGGKELPVETIGEITSSSPEIGSGNSSLSNGHSSLSDVINDWKRELEEKNFDLRNKIAIISDLESRLRERDSQVFDIQRECKEIEVERDKNCRTVRYFYSFFSLSKSKCHNP
jgi:hypothetical protein